MNALFTTVALGFQLAASPAFVRVYTFRGQATLKITAAIISALCMLFLQLNFLSDNLLRHRYLRDVLSDQDPTYAAGPSLLCLFPASVSPALTMTRLNTQTLVAIISLFISLEVTSKLFICECGAHDRLICSRPPRHNYRGFDMAISGGQLL
jgi:hypothetical protein